MPDDERSDDDLLADLADALRAPEREPAPDRIAALRRRVEARGGLAADGPAAAARDEVADRRAGRRAEEVERRRSRRALLRGGAAAAVGSVVGAVGALALVGDGDGGRATDPPTEPVAFATVPEGIVVTGRTIDHTWGMELLLDVAGLPDGAAYEVRYATAAGPVAAGGFRAVGDVTVRCRCNGTALRSDVAAVEVVDLATGRAVLAGTLA